MAGGTDPRRIWHVANDDGSSFELPEDSLVNRISRGDLPKHTLVWNPGMADWQPAGRVLSRYFVPPPVPPGIVATVPRSNRSGSRHAARNALGWRSLFFSLRGRINRARFWIGQLVTVFWLLALSFGYWLVASYFARAGRNIAPEAAFQEELGSWLLVGAITVAVGLLWLVPLVAVTVKRLHDRDKSGWWCLAFSFLPGMLGGLSKSVDPPFSIGFALAGAAVAIWAFVEIGCLRGTRGTNRFGADPLAGDAP
jgi:uncharacterized membrane protein YhaH (DUF805 family)